MSDREVIQHVLRGNLGSFQELVVRYQALIFTICLKMVQDRGEAEDIAQEVFIQAYRSLSEYNGNAQFSTWLYRIAVNKCIDLRRKKARRIAIAQVTPQEEVINPVEEAPEQIVLLSERKREVYEMINRLSERYRDVIILYYFKQLKYKEIAKLLNIEVKTVETRMSRAKKKLLEIIKEGEMNDEYSCRRASDGLSSE